MRCSMIAAAVAAFAAPAAAQTVAAKDPDTLVRFLQAEGYKAKLDKDTEGDPKIMSNASGSPFQILFYGCEQHRDCTSVQFSSGYDTDDGEGPDLTAINAWNRDKRWVQAYVDKDGDPWLNMDVFTGATGLPQDTFKGAFEVWIEQMGAFEKTIGW